MPKNFLTVMLSFIKLGTIGFGGGAALIPVIERELVGNKKWMEKERFDVSVAISSISPASLPVSLCSLWDHRYALLSAYSYALPGPVIYLILLTGFSYIGDAGLMYLRYASVGLIAFVLFLLFRFIRSNYSHGVSSGIKTQYLLIMAISFLLTCGNVIGRLLSMVFGLILPTPLFAINMITLMLSTFFVMCFIGASKSKVKLISAVLIAVLFSLTNGRAGILSSWSLPLAILMLALAAVSIVRDILKKGDTAEKKTFHFDYRPFRNLILFILIAVLLTSATFFVSGDINVWDFAFKAIVSSLTSFGGGEVYIGISEATFVQTGFIPEINYSTQIIGIANTMPGPVLVSILTGVGYTYGNINHGVAFGWVFGLLGLSLAVTATAFGAITIFICFELLKGSERLKMIIKYIMPIVCGMLISTALSLLRQAGSVLVDKHINPLISIGIVLGITCLMLFVSKKLRVNDLILLVFGGAGTVFVLRAMDYLFTQH